MKLAPLPKRALEFLIVVAAAALVVKALLAVRIVVMPVLLAVLVSTLLVPPARRLRHMGMPPTASTVLVMVSAALVFLAVLGVVLPSFVNELGDLGKAVRGGVDELGRLVADGPFGLDPTQVERAIDQAVGKVGENSGALTRGVVSSALLVTEVIAGVLLALVVLVFLVHDGERIWGWVLSLIPARGREHVAAVGAEAWGSLTAYLRGVAFVALFDAVFIGIALALVGVPLVVPLMVLTFVAAFVPLVGAFAAGTVSVLVALVAQGVPGALIILAAIVLVQQLEGNLIYPVVVGRTLDLHPLAILLSVTAGSVLLGIPGALIAVPTAAVTWQAIQYERARRARERDAGNPLLVAASDAPPAAAERPVVPA